MTYINILLLSCLLLGFLTLALVIFVSYKVRAWADRLSSQINSAQSIIVDSTTSNVDRLTSEKSLEILYGLPLGSLGLTFPVFLGGWAIDTFLARFLIEHLLNNKVSTVVELGSGASTVLIARCMQILKNDSYCHFAIDHDPKYLQQTRRIAELNGVPAKLRFIDCPLQYVESISSVWYSGLAEELENVKIDLLLIDGPPKDTADNARYPALKVLRPFLSETSTIILDDTNRTTEREIVERWVKEYPELEAKFFSEGHGFAVLGLKEE